MVGLNKEVATVRENIVPILSLVAPDYGCTVKVTGAAGETIRCGVRFDGLYGYGRWEDRVSPGCVLVSIQHPNDFNTYLLWMKTFSVAERISRRLATLPPQ